MFNPLLRRAGDFSARKHPLPLASPELTQDFHFVSAVVDWNESTANFASLPVKLTPEIVLPGFYDLIRIYPLTFDDAGTFQSPNRSDLYLYAGSERNAKPLYAFRYRDYLRNGAGFSNLPPAVPITIFATIERLFFRIDFQPAATNTATTPSQPLTIDPTVTQSAVNARHRYGLRINFARFGPRE